MDDYMRTNQKWWNEAAQIHAQGEHYQLKELKEGMIKLFSEYNDIFAWIHDEMPDIPLALATHRLTVDTTFKLVKQKR